MDMGKYKYDAQKKANKAKKKQKKIELKEIKLRPVTEVHDYTFKIKIFKDGSINISDIVIMVNFVLGQTPTDEQFITGDMNYDGIINIVDIILIVNEVLGTTFAQSVKWLEENFPELKTKDRLSKLNKLENFAK